MQQIRLFLHGLRLGLFSMNPYTTVIMFTVSAVLLYILLLSPPRILVALLHVYPGISRAHDNLYIFMRAIDSRERATTNPVLFFLGASTLKRSIESEKYFADALAERGFPFNPVDLTSRGQPFWYGQKVIEAAAHGREGLVLISVNYDRLLNHPETNKRAQLFDPPLSNEWSLAGLKNRAAFLRQQVSEATLREDLRNVRRDKKSTLESNYDYVIGRLRLDNGPGDPIYRNKRVTSTINRFLAKGATTYEKEFTEAIVSLKKNLNSTGNFKLILVDTPRNPAIDSFPEMRPILARHREWLVTLAAQLDAGLIILPELVDYQESDFSDHSHFRTREAVKHTSDILIEKIAGAWRKHP
ncbi:MAG: hypothetical protein OEL83_18035 [Desulforhopalus sp.]|nr:hypothetical protein [Desulforhopalus sp.]